MSAAAVPKAAGFGTPFPPTTSGGHGHCLDQGLADPGPRGAWPTAGSYSSPQPEIPNSKHHP